MEYAFLYQILTGTKCYQILVIKALFSFTLNILKEDKSKYSQENKSKYSQEDISKYPQGR